MTDGITLEIYSIHPNTSVRGLLELPPESYAEVVTNTQGRVLGTFILTKFNRIHPNLEAVILPMSTMGGGYKFWVEVYPHQLAKARVKLLLGVKEPITVSVRFKSL